MENKSKKPRDRFFVCSGKGGMQEIKAATEDEARAAFETSTGAKPKEVLGPYYEVKDTAPAPSLFISLKDASALTFSGKKITATFKNWPVTAQLTKAIESIDGTSYADNEVAFINLVPKDQGPEGVRRPRLGNTPLIPVSALNDVKSA